jgi:hypothetical protein
MLGSLCFHASDLGNLPIIVSYPITSLILFVHLYIVCRIRYCLVVYTVPCLGDHLCSGTRYDDCIDPPGGLFPMMYGSKGS